MFTEEFKKELAREVAEIMLTKLGRIIRPTVAPRWLTVQQAAEYTGHTKAGFEALMLKDHFPISRDAKGFDRLVRIDINDLDKFLMGRKG